MISTSLFKKLAYLTGLSILGSLIITYLGLEAGVLKEVNPVTKTFFQIHYYLPILIEGIVISGITIPAYRIKSVENLSKVTVYGILFVFCGFFLNLLRELILFVLSLGVVY